MLCLLLLLGLPPPPPPGHHIAVVSRWKSFVRAIVCVCVAKEGGNRYLSFRKNSPHPSLGLESRLEEVLSFRAICLARCVDVSLSA